MKIAGSLILTLLASPALAQDPGRGRLLYKTHCGAYWIGLPPKAKR